MKIVFEGSEEQIKLLKDEFDMLLIEYSEKKLPVLREDYQTENLWCVEDVKSKFECSNNEALEVLEQALTNDATMDQIWYAIQCHGEFNKLNPISEESEKEGNIMKKYIHHIVTTKNRDVTNVEVIYTNSNIPKFSMKIMVGVLKGVQYEIINRSNNKIQIVKAN